MKCLRPLLLIVLLALSGCARMTVQVDIFDRTGLDSRDVVESNARLAAAQQAAAVANNLYAKHAAEILYEVCRDGLLHARQRVKLPSQEHRCPFRFS